MKNTLLTLGVIGIIILGVFLFDTERSNTVNPSSKASVFDLSFSDYNGDIVSMSEFEGKPLVINAWAAWCPFCRKELVDFAEAQKEFGDEVTIIAIDRSETREVAKRYTDELGVTDSLVLLLDPKDSFYQSIGGQFMPETIFVNSEGEITIHKKGPMDLSEIREKINQLLAS